MVKGLYFALQQPLQKQKPFIKNLLCDIHTEYIFIVKFQENQHWHKL